MNSKQDLDVVKNLNTSMHSRAEKDIKLSSSSPNNWKKLKKDNSKILINSNASYSIIK